MLKKVVLITTCIKSAHLSRKIYSALHFCYIIFRDTQLAKLAVTRGQILVFKTNHKVTQRVHTREKPSNWVLSETSSNQQCDLQTHQSIQAGDGDKPFSCPQCEKYFFFKREP